MKGRAIQYSADQLAWIEVHRELPRPALHAEFCSVFGRSDISVDSLKALCTRKGWKTGRSGRFDKGIIPANKGKKMPYHPNSAATRFKAGQQPHNTHFAGHERVSKDGYVQISINETNPHTGFERRYVLKHRWLWEQVNGPLEPDMCLKCRDGNRQNVAPSNWEAVPRALLPRLAGGPHGRIMPYDSAPAVLKPAILAVAKLDHAVRARRQSKENTR